MALFSICCFIPAVWEARAVFLMLWPVLFCDTSKTRTAPSSEMKDCLLNMTWVMIAKWEWWSRMMIAVWGGLREGSTMSTGISDSQRDVRSERKDIVRVGRGEGWWALENKKTRTNRNAGQRALCTVDAWQECLRFSPAVSLRVVVS